MHRLYGIGTIELSFGKTVMFNQAKWKPRKKMDLSGRDACGDGSDGDSGEDGRMGLEADAGAVSEAEGGDDGAGDAAAPAAAIGPAWRRCSFGGAGQKEKEETRPARWQTEAAYS